MGRVDRRTKKIIGNDLYLRKNQVSKNAIKNGIKDPFEEVYEFKNLFIGHYKKWGLRIVPFREVSILGIAFTHRYDTLVISFLNLSLMIKNWTIRSNNKPNGAIGNFLIKFGKTRKNQSGI